MTVDWLVGTGLAALLAWVVLLALPWRPWSPGEPLQARPSDGPVDLSDLTVLIPARDEAELIATTVAAVRSQGVGHRILVIDDGSSDGTADFARAAGAEVIEAVPLATGWTGKLWALEQGRRQVVSPLILQLDADIELRPGVLPALVERFSEGLGLASIMAVLPTRTLVQRLLLPAYVWFFMLLYPFRLANGTATRSSAAAGGCLLVRADALQAIGGYRAIRHAVIDDCALAAAIKRAGHRTWIGLSRDVISRRACTTIAEVRDLVARTAYIQLRRSPMLLVACTLAMAWLFLLPPLLPLIDPTAPLHLTVAIGVGVAMVFGYGPLLNFYRLSPLWALALPVTAGLYLWMTWVSAWRHWRGHGAQWKGRRYDAADRSRV
ncbi:MAG TPA: glycosyl transferase [Xanthomonadales bacterium]|nr:glycosyl transferase [Xanthomonadales bacterium]